MLNNDVVGITVRVHNLERISLRHYHVFQTVARPFSAHY